MRPNNVRGFETRTGSALRPAPGLISRRGVLGSGLVLMAGGLVGCSRFGAGGSDTSAKGTVNMVWWGDASRAQLTEQALDLFRSSSGIKVTTEFQSGTAYDDKLAVRFAGGNPPDLLAMRRETLRDFGDRGSLIKLPVGAGIDVSGIAPSVLNAGKVGDAQYGIPAGVASVAWVINTALFQKYGVDMPDMATWDWDDFTDAAAEITKASGKKVYGADYPLDDMLTLGVWLRQHGMDVWTPEGRLGFTQEAIAEWFRFWTRLRDAGAVPAGGALESLGLAAEQSSIGRGVVASSSMPSNSYAAFNSAAGGKLTLGYFPGETQAERRGHQVIPVGHWSVSAKSKAQESAISLLDFLLKDVAANKVVGVTRGAAAKAAVASEVATTLSADDRASVSYTVELGKLDLVDPIPDPVGTSQFLQALGTVSEKVQFGKAGVQAAAAEFYARARSVIKN
ncbi:ABC transporter substrate-binding protein [Nonomuraea sp. NPDC004297]